MATQAVYCKMAISLYERSVELQVDILFTPQTYKKLSAIDSTAMVKAWKDFSRILGRNIGRHKIRNLKISCVELYD